MTDEQKSQKQAEAKAQAQELSKAKNPDEFATVLEKLLLKRGVTAEADISSAIKASDLADNRYDENFEVSKWAFGGAKLYETYVYENGTSYGVYMLTSLPERDETQTSSVRHILLTTETYKTDEATKKKAEEVLKEFTDGDKSEESFSALAAKYSEDPGSASNGGLYSDFPKGQMVAEFENWSFDAARKHGDVGIVKTSYGYHIMYFENMSTAWRSQAVSSIKGDKYNELFEKLKAQYEIKINKNLYKDIPVITLKSSAQ